MNHTVETDATGAANLAQQLKQCMQARHAVNMELIVHQTGARKEAVIKALEQLVSKCEVEVLRPVAAQTKPQAGPTLHPREHYRLVRSADRDFVWQLQIRESADGFSRHSRHRHPKEWVPASIPDSTWFLPWLQHACMAG